MRLSLIINTCCLDPFVANNKNQYAHNSYGERARFLKEQILPAAIAEGWDEIIVCGTFEAGDGYQYVPMPPIYRDRRDALWQREFGARHATGDIFAFSHDDHMFADGTLNALLDCDFLKAPWDILVPKRITKDGQLLNNGQQEDYMGGHSLLMKRPLWAQVPWTCVDTEWWDRSLTRIWREEGAKIVWTDSIQHIDLDEPILTS